MNIQEKVSVCFSDQVDIFFNSQLATLNLLLATGALPDKLSCDVLWLWNAIVQVIMQMLGDLQEAGRKQAKKNTPCKANMNLYGYM